MTNDRGKLVLERLEDKWLDLYSDCFDSRDNRMFLAIQKELKFYEKEVKQK